MFNLLPNADKAAIRCEYRLRLATVSLWFLFATLLSASFLLVPSLFLSSKKEEIARLRAESFRAGVSADDGPLLEKELRAAAGKIKLLRAEETAPYFHELFARIAALSSERISIASLSVARVNGGEYRVHIGGAARDRGALVAFQKELEKFTEFKEVTLPLSNLAKDTDIEFSINAQSVK